MEMKAAAPRCQLLLILLMSAVMLLPGTNGSLLLVQRTVTRTIVLQETIGKGVTRVTQAEFVSFVKLSLVQMAQELVSDTRDQDNVPVLNYVEWLWIILVKDIVLVTPEFFSYNVILKARWTSPVCPAAPG
ncbi:hypothetical protein STEG23_007466 [Scotinomys teguina]